MKTSTVMLAGNPNSGKSTLFNALTHANQQVANYPGSTVDYAVGHSRHGDREIDWIDLPGTYSLQAVSGEEEAAVSTLREMAPDAIVVVADASRLERGLYLTLELREENPRTILALNMMDTAEALGLRIDAAALAHELGIPVVPMVARRGSGVADLLDTVLTLAEPVTPLTPTDDQRSPFAPTDEQSSPFALAEQRFARIEELLAATVQVTPGRGENLREQIDRFALHPIWGYPILLLSIVGTFWLSFVASAPLSNAVTAALTWAGARAAEGIAALGAASWVQSFLIDGVFAGVAAVLSFVPYLAVFYLLYAALQDSGYIARAAILVDRFMQAIGLHGKGFFALVTAYGCNVPALAATRGIENPRDRLLHMLVIPLIPCNARLGALVVLTAAFFPGGRGAFVLAGLLLLDLLTVAGVASFYQHGSLPAEPAPLVMELPDYHLPTWRNVLLPTWMHVRAFISRIWRFLLWATMAIWALTYFPVGSTPATSYAALLGSWLAVPGSLLHFDGSMMLALLFGFVAKETTLATLAVLSGTGVAAVGTLLASQVAPLTAVAFLAFYVLYFPCLATFTEMLSETHSWRWTVRGSLVTLSAATVVAALIEAVGAFLGYAL